MIFLRSRYLYWDGVGFVRATPFPPQPVAAKSGSDSLVVSVAESASVAVTESGSAGDSLSVAITDAASVAAHVSASDSLNIGATESASVTTSSPFKSGSDTAAVALSEAARLASNQASIGTSDTLAVSLTEAGSKAVQSVTPPPGSPSSGLNERYVGGPVYIGNSRRFQPHPAAADSDTARVSLIEEANVAVHLSASDDLGVGTSSGSGDEVIAPVPFDQIIRTVDDLNVALSESALFSTTSGSDVSWTANTDLKVRILENAQLVTTDNQRIYNEVIGLRLVEHASRLHIYPTGGTTPPNVGDNLGVGLGEGYSNQFSGSGTSRLGTYGYLRFSFVEQASIGIASVAQAFNTATWLDVAFTGASEGVLLSLVGIEVIYTRVPARTTTDTAWPTTARIQEDYPEESYANFSFTG